MTDSKPLWSEIDLTLPVLSKAIEEARQTGRKDLLEQARQHARDLEYLLLSLERIAS